MEEEPRLCRARGTDRSVILSRNKIASTVASLRAEGGHELTTSRRYSRNLISAAGSLKGVPHAGVGGAVSRSPGFPECRTPARLVTVQRLAHPQKEDS